MAPVALNVMTGRLRRQPSISRDVLEQFVESDLRCTWDGAASMIEGMVRDGYLGERIIDGERAISRGIRMDTLPSPQPLPPAAS